MGNQYRQEGRVRVIRDGKDVEMFYRQAVGLISRGLAEWSKDDPRRGKETASKETKKSVPKTGPGKGTGGQGASGRRQGAV